MRFFFSERSLSTASASASCAALMNITSVLQREVLSRFEHAIHQFAVLHGSGNAANSNAGPNLGAQINKFLTALPVLSGSASVSKAKAERLLILTTNNLQMSCQHLDTLREHAEILSAHEFGSQVVQSQQSHSQSAQSLQSELASATDAASQQARTMVMQGIQELAEASRAFKVVLGRAQNEIVSLLFSSAPYSLRVPLESLSISNYELTEQHYNEASEMVFIANSPVTQAPPNTNCNPAVVMSILVSAISRELSLQCPLRRCLTESNFVSLVGSVAQFMVERFEAIIFRKRFTFWGGVIFYYPFIITNYFICYVYSYNLTKMSAN